MTETWDDLNLRCDAYEAMCDALMEAGVKVKDGYNAIEGGALRVSTDVGYDGDFAVVTYRIDRDAKRAELVSFSGPTMIYGENTGVIARDAVAAFLTRSGYVL